MKMNRWVTAHCKNATQGFCVDKMTNVKHKKKIGKRFSRMCLFCCQTGAKMSKYVPCALVWWGAKCDCSGLHGNRGIHLSTASVWCASRTVVHLSLLIVLIIHSYQQNINLWNWAAGGLCMCVHVCAWARAFLQNGIRATCCWWWTSSTLQRKDEERLSFCYMAILMLTISSYYYSIFKSLFLAPCLGFSSVDLEAIYLGSVCISCIFNPFKGIINVLGFFLFWINIWSNIKFSRLWWISIKSIFKSCRPDKDSCNQKYNHILPPNAQT